MAKPAPIQFNYSVGRPWNPEKPEDSVGCYAMGSEHFFGTMAQARTFKAYCNATLSPTQLKTNPYRIYKLVEIPE